MVPPLSINVERCPWCNAVHADLILNKSGANGEFLGTSECPVTKRDFAIFRDGYSLRFEAMLRNKAATPQPQPQLGRTQVLGFVWMDLVDRANVGKQKYGTFLETHNGRDALMDAYQEALDLVMYLKQALMERDNT